MIPVALNQGPAKKRRLTTAAVDRFIPLRGSFSKENNLLVHCSENEDLDESYADFQRLLNHNNNDSPANVSFTKYLYLRNSYSDKLKRALSLDDSKVLNFSPGKRKLPVVKETNWPVHPRKKPTIGSPICVLDLPDIQCQTGNNPVDWSANGMVATVFERKIHVFETGTSTEKTMNTRNYVNNQIKWSPSNPKNLTAVYNNNSVGIWNAKSMKKLESTVCCFLNPCKIVSLLWTTNFIITACSSLKLSVFTNKLKLIKTVHNGNPGEIIVMKENCNEHYLATSCKESMVYVWKLPFLEIITRVSYSHVSHTLAWHPWKSSTLVVGGNSKKGYLSLWHIGEGDSKLITHNGISRKSHGFIDALSFNPKTAELAVAISNNEKKTHRILVFENIKDVVDEINFHTAPTPFLMWSPDGAKLATASRDESLCIWQFLDEKKRKMSSLKPISTSNSVNWNSFEFSFGEWIR